MVLVLVEKEMAFSDRSNVHFLAVSTQDNGPDILSAVTPVSPRKQHSWPKYLQEAESQLICVSCLNL